MSGGVLAVDPVFHFYYSFLRTLRTSRTGHGCGTSVVQRSQKISTRNSANDNPRGVSSSPEINLRGLRSLRKWDYTLMRSPCKPICLLLRPPFHRGSIQIPADPAQTWNAKKQRIRRHQKKTRKHDELNGHLRSHLDAARKVSCYCNGTTPRIPSLHQRRCIQSTVHEERQFSFAPSFAFSIRVD